ncbi:hypothetical protein G4228_008189 [Cervus hanglu yarkandensis]|nr:hypothetical protein G4228_008189 [Cervus hanglu yarkandensis]
MRPRAPLLRLLLAVSAAAAAVVGEPGTALSPTTGGATLAIVFDVTGSMWDDLMQVLDGASRILERSLSRGSRVIANYALVPFHDPDIGPVTLTSDPAVFQRELRELYVQGGGDCPEMSLGAIKAAVEVANPGSFIYVFSDARAKDYHKKDEVLRLLQLKQSQVVFVLTGDCGDRTHPGYLAYEEIAAASSGQVFHLDKQQVTEVLKWVESAIQASKVHLLSTDHEEGGEHTWRIPFDPSLKEVTISLSGPGPEIEVRDPLGTILQRDDGLNVLLSIPDSAKVVAFKPEHPGLWSIKVYSSGRHSVRITGISNIDFRAGFSTQPSLDLNHTIEWPLQGVPISLVINSTGLRVPGRLDSVELSHSSGRSLLTLPTQPLSNGSTHQLWGGPPFHSPQERFYLKVKGKDHEGNPLLRVSGVSYRGVTPGAPLVSMPPRTHGYLHQPLRVSCSVHSALPFRLQLWREGARLGEERRFRESGNSSWEIPWASKADEGMYECTAVSRAGTGRARAQIVVTDPPPQLVPVSNVTVSPGETAVLSCLVLSEAPYNLTWVRDWRVLSASMGRVTQLADLSLEVRNTTPSDGGRYQCMASNSNGVSRASVWLLVREAPQVSIHTRSQRFSQGMEVRVRCSASGYPAPRISWSREGRALQEDSRVRVDAQGTLIIQGVAPEDAGSYSCQAANEIGRDEETVTLYYTDPPSVSAVNGVVLAAEGEEAVLACEATGVPPPRVIWYRGDLEMILASEDSSSGMLRIPVVHERDAGVYTCRAVNELGDASAEIRLEVGRVVPEDQAPYICEAQNVFGKVQAQAHLLVTGHVDQHHLPSLQPPPQIASSASTVRVLERQPVSLPCIVLSGRPRPERRWLKAGMPETNALASGDPHYNVSKDGTLVIPRPSVQDAGAYVCTATNAVGFSSQEMWLSVNTKPRILVNGSHEADKPLRVTAKAGDEVILDCEAQGSPPPLVTWTKDSRPMLPMTDRHHLLLPGSLHLAQAQVSDSGLYECTASNPAGSATQYYILRVQVPPQVQPGPRVLKVLVGEAVDLNCVAEGNPEPRVAWSKDGVALRGEGPEGSVHFTAIQTSHAGTYRCEASSSAGVDAWELDLRVLGTPKPQVTWRKGPSSEPLRGRPGLAVLDEGSLFLASVSPSDGGDYECQATNEAGSASRRAKLVVHVPPSLREDGRRANVSGMAGQSLTLECDANGFPAPEITWLKDGRQIPAVGGHRLLDGARALHFPRIQEGDSGLYSCRAENQAGIAQRDFDLLVLTPPTIWGSNETSEVAVMEGHPVWFLCEARGVPMPDITWFKDGDPLVPSAEVVYTRGGRQLQLERAQGSDAGTYSCKASNAVGVVEKTTRLEVYVPPTIEGTGEGPRVVKAVAGRPLTLECVARGYPPPTVSWYHEGLPLVESNGTWLEAGGGVLSLESLGEASGGLYSCVASSPAGEAVLHYSVEVQVAPQLLVAEGLGQVTTLVGQSLDLPCLASGFPVPTIQWLQNGRPAEELPGVRVALQGTMLHIDRVELGHAGLFACQATNEAGTAGAEVELSVHELPSVVIVGSENITAPFLQPVTLRCAGTGVPTPSLRWWKDGAALAASGGSLQIEKVDLKDEGIYTCVATNLAGESRRDVTLRVLVPPNIEPDLVNKAVLENASVTLECLASGVPPPDISWFKGRQPVSARDRVMVSIDGRILLIEQAQLSDAGSYRCVASNVAGSTELQYNLQVNVPPRITLPPSLPGPVLLHSPVRLTCNATGTPSPLLMWLKDGNPVSTAGTTGLQVFPGGRVLTLASARASDSGSYSCVAVSAVGEDRRDVFLHVHTPPSFLGEEQNVSVVANESVALECWSYAVPPPVLSWRKDGRPLEPRPGVHLSTDKALLEVERAEVGDTGRYTCEALNLVGRSQKHYNLNVWVPPVFPSREPRILTVTEGHPARLSCDCRGVPFPKISWKKDGQPLPREGASLGQVSTVGQLLYLGQAQPAQEGTYTCECSNVAGNSSQDQQLVVYVPPQIAGPAEPYADVSVVQDEEASLECNATGKPAPSVTWERDGWPVGTQTGLRLQNHGQSLHVERAQPAHAGRYSCVAENEAGRAERWFSLSVLVPPELIGDLDPLTNVTASLHNPLSLFCEATGVPPPEVRWFRGEEPVSPGENTYLLAGGWMLKLTRAQEQDRGFYSCLASNKAGEARRNFSVEVLVPPSIEKEDLEEAVKVPEGETAQLRCNVSGHPQPKVTWFKDGRPLASGDTHHVSPDGAFLWVLQANLSSAGHYSCVAANAIGEKTKHFQFSVLVVPTILGVTEDSVDEEVTVTINNPISLICEALAFPSPTITWMKDGAPFEASNNIQLLPAGTHGLQILNAQKEDAGQYTCVVTNELGEAVKNYHVEVLIPPSISKDDPLGEVSVKEVKTKVNSTLTLECECWAVPPPTISWYKDGQPVTPNLRVRILGGGRLLQIQPTQVSDSGRYLCVATNVAGEDDQDFNVLIQVPPMFHKSDATAVFETPFREEEARGGVTEYREVVENNPAYLYCDTNAVPAPELTWFREDHPLSIEDGVSILQGGRVLQIPLVRAEDAGRYSCRASNEAGEDWLHYELLVLTPPVILGETEELVEEVTVNANSTVSLYCPALGNPAPTISWLQNGLPFSPSPRLQVLEDGRILQVSTAEVADAASYMCVADNPAGSAEKLFTLRVQVPPRITGPNPEQITTTINSSVSLPCEVRAHPSPEVTWYKDSRTLSLGEEGFLLPGTHTLQLARAQLSDSGMYMCEALNAAGRDQKLVQLSVLVPPTFRQAPSRPQDAVLVSAGDKAVLSCETDALPAPTVAWQKDGQPLVLAERIQALLGGQRLEIQDAQVSDRGLYSCRVSNAAGEAMRAFSLTVQVPPTFENPETETVSQVAGSPLVLSCDVTGVPAPTVTWLKDRMPVAESSVAHGVVSRGGRLQLSHLQPDQAGTYTCVAENAQAEARKDFVVAVLVAPRIWSSGTTQEHSVLEGQDVRLDCEAYGQPPPDVVWLKDGHPLDLSLGPYPWFYLDNSSLVLKGLRASDSGAYTCVAHNAAGEDARLHTVNVLVPPVLVPAEFQNDVAVVRGSLVFLPCEARGSPLPFVSWMKDGEPLLPPSVEHGPGLLLESAEAGHTGTYSCVAMSEAGEARRHFQLTVMDPPYIEDSGEPEELLLTPGTPLELLCDARGTPAPNITWHKDGQALSSPEDGKGARRMLQVESMQVGDAGLYTCLAHSPAGEAEKSFRVRVQAPPNVIGPHGPRFVVGLAPGQLVLECSVEADPAPEIEWHREGVLLQADAHTQFPEEGRFLQLQALSTADSGDYSCTARNAAGSTSLAFHVEVHMVPTIHPGPPIVNASMNQTTLLPCQADGAPRPLVSWLKDGVPLDPESPRFQILSEGSLRIQPVLAQDAGHYLCLASNPAGSDRQGRDLRVFEPPTIAPGPSNLTLTAHTPASLPCEASGSPKPLVAWWKDGQKLDFRLHQGTYRLLPSNALLLEAPSPQDSAQFECVVSNEVGEARKLYWVMVHVAPTIADDQTDFTVTVRAPVVLTCHSTGMPAPVVSWSKAGTRLGVRGNGYRVLPSGALEIGQALPIHTGRYTCTARNAAGMAHKHVVLTVRASPVVKPLPSVVWAVAKEEVLLPCEASGLPRPSITWQKEGLSVPAGAGTQVLPSGQLRIIHVSPEDAGNYFCLAQNSAGSAVGKTRLVVQEGVSEQDGGSTLQRVAVTREDSGTYICWAENRVGRVQVVSFVHVKGQYQCLAENELGAVEKVVVLALQSAPVFQVKPQDVTVRSGDSVALRCQASGEPVPTVEWLRAGQPVRASRRLQTLPDGSLWLERVEAGDAGPYECVAHNLLGSATARAFLVVRGEPRGSRGSVIGVINGQKFGAAILNTSVQQEARSGATTIRSSISHIPASVGPLMRVLVVTIAPIYWALAGESGDALNGHSLTGGSFQQESHVEFATGELLTMTQVARGLDRNGLLLLDMVVNGNVPESLADADLQVQDFQERYVQTGPGRLFVGSTQSFLQDSLRSFLRCNHSIRYSAAQGPQPQLVQHLRASSISSAFDPEAEALRFQLDTALQAEENEVGCPEGFELDAQGEFCVDRDECSDRPRPCSHSCHNAPGRFSCSCPAGFALARDGRTCRDVDECAWEADLCQEDQHCVNLLGSYHCLPDCRPGFRVAADGASCEDVDECLEQTDDCHYNQICENIPGGHRCSCPRGFRVQGPGLPCLDINECLQLPEPCAYQCHNLQGGFRCLCPPGQALLRDGKTCTPLERSGPNVTTVSHRDLLVAWLRARAPKPGGSYHTWVSLQPGPRALSVGRAWCPPGFIRQNGVCTDINECEEDGIECGPGQMCFNTRGSYQCVDTPCPATYRQGSSPGTCFRRCSQDCSSGGPSTLQYKLLPLPLGVRALHDVARLAAFSEAGVPANRTELRVLEPDPRSPFALRPLRAGYGAVYTRRALTRAGLYRLTVHAAAPRHQSVFVLLIAVSPYPY